MRLLMKSLAIVAVATGLSGCAAMERAGSGGEMARIVGRGDIHRDRPPDTEKRWVPLYQANGRFGSCYGPWGLHLRPGHKQSHEFPGVTVLTHMRHWVRGKYNADYLLPVATMYWAEEPTEIQKYEQRESFYDATVTTRFSTPKYRASIVTWFDPVHRDVAGYRIDVEGEPPPIVFTPMRELSVHYDQHLEASIESKLDGHTWRATVRCLNAKTPITLSTEAGLKAAGDGVEIALKPGRNDILVAVGGELDTSAEDSFKANTSWWHSTWEHSGWLDLPDDDAQKVWVRGIAYTLYSHNDDGIGCSPPTGLAGNGWPFPFPFDSGCRQPLLLWTGQIDAARKWVEFWASRADGLRQYTKRIWKLDGIMCPHVFPYGPAEDYHLPGLPNDNYAPIYNAGHMVRIAHQTAVVVNDPAWTKKYAAPLIQGAAEFYLSMAKKGDDGLWHFTVIPSLGLDEEAERDQADYYCTLVSAEYALRQGIAYGFDSDGRMKTILDDGIAYKTLLSPQGLYYAYAGKGSRNLGHQKHPDQLAPLVHIPLGGEPDEPTRRGFEQRYEITDGAKKPWFTGHTLGEFILADARMHDAAGWRKEWASVQISKNADPDWIQIFESGRSSLSFYITTHGLFAQSILETIVSTWWGRLDLAPCIPWSGTVRFGNIRTLLGVTVGGELTDGRGKVKLSAWKDTQFECRGRQLSLKKGEQVVIDVN